MSEASFRLAAVTLDEHTVVRRTREIEHEREIALYDLLESNSFRPVGSPGGPYNLVLGIEENRLIFDIRSALDEPLRKVMLSLTAFRRIVKDYFLICESYFKAIGGSQTPYQIEALDMGRRGLHDEGATLLRDHLKGKVEMDFDTARRLFTLICVLHLKG
ncbi:MAG: UPF0262 family protein [Alphaproteobacteria bacterium]|nr:UPF0262 family protein [Alphaproteobacteria bacterium]MDE2162999.1 UPF0262 family protein [Alphaproteobacteria bacterium]MDE2265617.1 UPF0262 family protein [Alphaproteobacteria bacterium]